VGAQRKRREGEKRGRKGERRGGTGFADSFILSSINSYNNSNSYQEAARIDKEVSALIIKSIKTLTSNIR